MATENQPGTTPADDAAAAAAAEAAKANASDASLDLRSDEQKAADKAAADAAKNAASSEAEVEYVYQPTGDTGLDVALEYIGKLGFAADNPAVEAATKGDFDPLRKALAKLGKKAEGFERFVKLGEEAFTRRTNDAKAKEAALEGQIHKAVGGAETWEQIRAFVAKEADQAEKEEIAKAFKAGGLQAVAVAEKLRDVWQRRGGKPKAAVKEDAAAAASSGDAGLSPREFAAEVRKLAGKTRGPIDNTPEYAALRRRLVAHQRHN